MLNGLLLGHRHQYVKQPLRHLPHVLQDPNIAAFESKENGMKLLRRELVEYTQQLALYQVNSVRVDNIKLYSQ